MSQFVGKWKVESEENLDELFKACGKSTFKWVFLKYMKVRQVFILFISFYSCVRNYFYLTINNIRHY